MTTLVTITAKGQPGCGKTLSLLAIERLLDDYAIAGNFLNVYHHALLSPDGDTEVLQVEMADPAELLTFFEEIKEVDARNRLYDEIDTELAYQFNKWGTEADDTQNTPWMWVSYITQYATKWMKGLFCFPTSITDEFRKCMIKVAATAIAAVESLDRQRAKNGKAFYEVEDTKHGGNSEQMFEVKFDPLSENVLADIQDALRKSSSEIRRVTGIDLSKLR